MVKMYHIYSLFHLKDGNSKLMNMKILKMTQKEFFKIGFPFYTVNNYTKAV